MNFVLDASVALSWAFADEGGHYSERVLRRLSTEEAVVPAIWPLEIANALAVAERKQRLTPTRSAQFSRLILALPIALEPAERGRDLEMSLRLARSRDLSAYDASYLDLSLRYGIPLATLDGRLADAAAVEGVERFGE